MTNALKQPHFEPTQTEAIAIESNHAPSDPNGPILIGENDNGLLLPESTLVRRRRRVRSRLAR
jgi:hypothetical protein